MRPLPDHVETERLTLRTWRTADAEAMGHAIAANLEHLRPWMPWAAAEPLPLEAREQLIAGWDERRRAGGEVVYGIFCEGAIAGGTGLHRRSGPECLEIGYWIHVDFLRRGFAREVSETLTDVAFTVPGIDRVEIHHDRANRASGGVPRSIGYDLVDEMPTAVTAPGEEGVNCRWATTRVRWRVPSDRTR